MSVIEYITEEVHRQGHDTAGLDGIQRVGWMTDAWSFALTHIHKGPPKVIDALFMGHVIEPSKNCERIGDTQWVWNYVRRVGVRVGSKICPDAQEIPRLLKRLWKHQEDLKPFEFYREFLDIHPFVDGNGRTAKVLLNWMNDTLLCPIFPPDDFWGVTIRNP
jgi:hypothetical protein